MSLHIKRAYEKVAGTDGYRVLVDRLWPRGIAKEDARIDLWLREVAPSSKLRKHWHSTKGWHEGAGFQEFCEAYSEELQSGPQHDALNQLKHLLYKHPSVTLITASKDPEISHLRVITHELG